MKRKSSFLFENSIGNYDILPSSNRKNRKHSDSIIFKTDITPHKEEVIVEELFDDTEILNPS